MGTFAFVRVKRNSLESLPVVIPVSHPSSHCSKNMSHVMSRPDTPTSASLNKLYNGHVHHFIRGAYEYLNSQRRSHVWLRYRHFRYASLSSFSNFTSTICSGVVGIGLGICCLYIAFVVEYRGSDQHAQFPEEVLPKHPRQPGEIIVNTTTRSCRPSHPACTLLV